MHKYRRLETQQGARISYVWGQLWLNRLEFLQIPLPRIIVHIIAHCTKIKLTSNLRSGVSNLDPMKFGNTNLVLSGWRSTVDLLRWVTVMLVTSLCWWLYDGDRFEMLVAESLCWWLFSLCWWFFKCIKSVTNILKRSSTSQTCHQHIWSPTSATNIDVTGSHAMGVRWSFHRERVHELHRENNPISKESLINVPTCTRAILIGAQ